MAQRPVPVADGDLVAQIRAAGQNRGESGVSGCEQSFQFAYGRGRFHVDDDALGTCSRARGSEIADGQLDGALSRRSQTSAGQAAGSRGC